MSEFKAGDVVWVKVTASDLRYVAADVDNGQEGVIEFPPFKRDVRTDADFKDPLDDAIVEAAVEWAKDIPKRGKPVLLHEDEMLMRAVQAKLDVAKPKSAEEVIAAAISLKGVTCEHGQPGNRFLPLGQLYREGIESELTQYVLKALREAGLLKDDES